MKSVRQKQLTEIVICQNDDDIEVAQDPFGENDLMFPIKEEYIEPSYDEFDYNQVQLVQMHVKPDTGADSDHDESHNAHSNDFDQCDDDFGPMNDDSDDDFTPFTAHDEAKSTATFDEMLVPQLKCEVKLDNDDCKTEIDSLTEAPKVEKNERPKRKNAKVKSYKEKSGDDTPRIKEKPHSKVKTSNKVKSTASKTDSKTDETKRKKGRPKSEVPHQCLICDKQYEYASLLKVHTRTHQIDKGHNCPVCKKSFARLDHYKQHINNVHKGEVVDGIERKPTFERKCDICGKIFFHSGNLRKHMLLHSGERPFSCNECGYVLFVCQKRRQNTLPHSTKVML